MSHQHSIGKFLLKNKLARNNNINSQVDYFPLVDNGLEILVLHLNEPTIQKGSTITSEGEDFLNGPKIELKLKLNENDYKVYKIPDNPLLMPQDNINQIFFINKIIRLRTDQQTNNLDTLHTTNGSNISNTEYNLFNLLNNENNNTYKFSGTETGNGIYKNVNGFTINDNYGLFYNSKYNYTIYGFEVITGTSHEIIFSDIVTLPPNVEQLLIAPQSNFWINTDKGINIGVDDLILFTWRLNTYIIGGASVLQFNIYNPFNNSNNLISSTLIEFGFYRFKYNFDDDYVYGKVLNFNIKTINPNNNLNSSTTQTISITKPDWGKETNQDSLDISYSYHRNPIEGQTITHTHDIMGNEINYQDYYYIVNIKQLIFKDQDSNSLDNHFADKFELFNTNTSKKDSVHPGFTISGDMYDNEGNLSIVLSAGSNNDWRNRSIKFVAIESSNNLYSNVNDTPIVIFNYNDITLTYPNPEIPFNLKININKSNGNSKFNLTWDQGKTLYINTLGVSAETSFTTLYKIFEIPINNTLNGYQSLEDLTNNSFSISTLSSILETDYNILAEKQGTNYQTNNQYYNTIRAFRIKAGNYSLGGTDGSLNLSNYGSILSDIGYAPDHLLYNSDFQETYVISKTPGFPKDENNNPVLGTVAININNNLQANSYINNLNQFGYETAFQISISYEIYNLNKDGIINSGIIQSINTNITGVENNGNFSTGNLPTEIISYAPDTKIRYSVTPWTNFREITNGVNATDNDWRIGIEVIREHTKSNNSLHNYYSIYEPLTKLDSNSSNTVKWEYKRYESQLVQLENEAYIAPLDPDSNDILTNFNSKSKQLDGKSNPTQLKIATTSDQIHFDNNDLLTLVSLSNKTSESGSYQISKGDSIDVIVWPPSDTKFFNCDSNYMTNKPLVQVYRSQTGIIEPLYIISFKKMNADHTENNSWNNGIINLPDGPTGTDPSTGGYYKDIVFSKFPVEYKLYENAILKKIELSDSLLTEITDSEIDNANNANEYNVIFSYKNPTSSHNVKSGNPNFLYNRAWNNSNRTFTPFLREINKPIQKLYNVETENINITQRFASGENLPAFVSVSWKLFSLYAYFGNLNYKQIFNTIIEQNPGNIDNISLYNYEYQLFSYGIEKADEWDNISKDDNYKYDYTKGNWINIVSKNGNNIEWEITGETITKIEISIGNSNFIPWPFIESSPVKLELFNRYTDWSDTNSGDKLWNKMSKMIIGTNLIQKSDNLENDTNIFEGGKCYRLEMNTKSIGVLGFPFMSSISMMKTDLESYWFIEYIKIRKNASNNNENYIEIENFNDILTELNTYLSVSLGNITNQTLDGWDIKIGGSDKTMYMNVDICSNIPAYMYNLSNPTIINNNWKFNVHMPIQSDTGLTDQFQDRHIYLFRRNKQQLKRQGTMELSIHNDGISDIPLDTGYDSHNNSITYSFVNEPETGQIDGINNRLFKITYTINDNWVDDGTNPLPGFTLHSGNNFATYYPNFRIRKFDGIPLSVLGGQFAGNNYQNGHGWYGAVTAEDAPYIQRNTTFDSIFSNNRKIEENAYSWLKYVDTRNVNSFQAAFYRAEHVNAFLNLWVINGHDICGNITNVTNRYQRMFWQRNNSGWADFSDFNNGYSSGVENILTWNLNSGQFDQSIAPTYNTLHQFMFRQNKMNCGFMHVKIIPGGSLTHNDIKISLASAFYFCNSWINPISTMFWQITPSSLGNSFSSQSNSFKGTIMHMPLMYSGIGGNAQIRTNQLIHHKLIDYRDYYFDYGNTFSFNQALNGHSFTNNPIWVSEFYIIIWSLFQSQGGNNGNDVIVKSTPRPIIGSAAQNINDTYIPSHVITASNTSQTSVDAYYAKQQLKDFSYNATSWQFKQIRGDLKGYNTIKFVIDALPDTINGEPREGPFWIDSSGNEVEILWEIGQNWPSGITSWETNWPRENGNLIQPPNSSYALTSGTGWGYKFNRNTVFPFNLLYDSTERTDSVGDQARQDEAEEYIANGGDDLIKNQRNKLSNWNFIFDYKDFINNWHLSDANTSYFG